MSRKREEVPAHLMEEYTSYNAQAQCTAKCPEKHDRRGGHSNVMHGYPALDCHQRCQVTIPMPRPLKRLSTRVNPIPIPGRRCGGERQLMEADRFSGLSALLTRLDKPSMIGTL